MDGCHSRRQWEISNARAGFNLKCIIEKYERICSDIPDEDLDDFLVDDLDKPEVVQTISGRYQMRSGLDLGDYGLEDRPFGVRAPISSLCPDESDEEEEKERQSQRLDLKTQGRKRPYQPTPPLPDNDDINSSFVQSTYYQRALLQSPSVEHVCGGHDFVKCVTPQPGRPTKPSQRGQGPPPRFRISHLPDNDAISVASSRPQEERIMEDFGGESTTSFCNAPLSSGIGLSDRDLMPPPKKRMKRAHLTPVPPPATMNPQETRRVVDSLPKKESVSQIKELLSMIAKEKGSSPQIEKVKSAKRSSPRIPVMKERQQERKIEEAVKIVEEDLSSPRPKRMLEVAIPGKFHLSKWMPSKRLTGENKSKIVARGARMAMLLKDEFKLESFKTTEFRQLVERGGCIYQMTRCVLEAELTQCRLLPRRLDRGRHGGGAERSGFGPAYRPPTSRQPDDLLSGFGPVVRLGPLPQPSRLAISYNAVNENFSSGMDDMRSGFAPAVRTLKSRPKPCRAIGYDEVNEKSSNSVEEIRSGFAPVVKTRNIRPMPQRPSLVDSNQQNGIDPYEEVLHDGIGGESWAHKSSSKRNAKLVKGKNKHGKSSKAAKPARKNRSQNWEDENSPIRNAAEPFADFNDTSPLAPSPGSQEVTKERKNRIASWVGESIERTNQNSYEPDPRVEKFSRELRRLTSGAKKRNQNIKMGYSDS